MACDIFRKCQTVGCIILENSSAAGDIILTKMNRIGT